MKSANIVYKLGFVFALLAAFGCVGSGNYMALAWVTSSILWMYVAKQKDETIALKDKHLLEIGQQLKQPDPIAYTYRDTPPSVCDNTPSDPSQCCGSLQQAVRENRVTVYASTDKYSWYKLNPDGSWKHYAGTLAGPPPRPPTRPM